MKNRMLEAVCVGIAVILTVCSGTVFADFSGLTLNVDSAPNVYGSPDWAPWWAATKADIVNGTFTNLRTGTHPGTTKIDPYDEIVYSTGDLGKRLHWIYRIPDTTVADMDGLFEVKWVIDWGGDNWTYDGGWASDGAEVGWTQPGSWEDHSDGSVIGSLGFAWWATDNDAPVTDTGGSPYDEVDQADIDALRNDVLGAQTFATGFVRFRDTVNDDWSMEQLTVNVVPVPGAVLLGMLGLSVAGLKLRKRA